MQAYSTLRSSASDEYVVNKSRFIAYAAPCSTEEEALEFIRQIRERHRNATHNCYAYIIGQNAGIMRYSDDGEPSGTAGMPIMDVLKKNGLVNCCVVVTRYFGGILLGAGGLVRAYSHSAVIGITAAVPVLMEPTQCFLCDVPYSLWDKFRYTMEGLPVRWENAAFSSSVQTDLFVRSAQAENVIEKLTAATDGRAEFLLSDESWYPWETKISGEG